MSAGINSGANWSDPMPARESSAPTVDQLRELIVETVSATLKRAWVSDEGWDAAKDRQTRAQAALDQALRALSEELDLLRLDAARLDYAEAHGWGEAATPDGGSLAYDWSVHRKWMPGTPITEKRLPTLREAIDAARSAGAPQEGTTP